MELLLEDSKVDYSTNIKYRCYKYSIDVIKFIQTIEINKIYNSILDQVLRSATSIGANIIEGKSGSSKKDLIKFYQIALKSANETKYWLCLLRDSFDLSEKVSPLLKEADELSKIIAASILTMKSNLNNSKTA